MEIKNDRIKLFYGDIEKSDKRPETSGLEELLSELLVDCWVKEGSNNRKILTETSPMNILV